VQKTGAIGEKHEESAKADGGPEYPCDQRSGTDDTGYPMQRRRLGEFTEFFVMLMSMMVVVMTVIAPATSP